MKKYERITLEEAAMLLYMLTLAFSVSLIFLNAIVTILITAYLGIENSGDFYWKIYSYIFCPTEVLLLVFVCFYYFDSRKLEKAYKKEMKNQKENAVVNEFISYCEKGSKQDA